MCPLYLECTLLSILIVLNLGLLFLSFSLHFLFGVAFSRLKIQCMPGLLLYHRMMTFSNLDILLLLQTKLPSLSFLQLYVLPVSFVFRIAVLPHSSGLVYYHLLLERKSRISGVSFLKRNLGCLCAYGEITSIHSQPLGSYGPLQE